MRKVIDLKAIELEKTKVHRDSREFFKKAHQRAIREGDKFLGVIQGEISGYCPKCHKIKPMKDVYKIEYKSKVIFYRGRCPECNTEIYKKRG